MRQGRRTSGLNQLKCRVETLQLDAGVSGGKAPVSFDVAVAEPGGNLSLEAATVRDAPIGLRLSIARTIVETYGVRFGLKTAPDAVPYFASPYH